MEHGELVAACLKKIDRVQLRVCRDVFPGTTWAKFFAVDDFLPMAAMHALRYDAELPRGANCLDVGAGFGFVSLALECLGHKCVAWDAPAPILENVSRAIPLHVWMFHKIERQEEIPAIPPGAFDLVFLHGVIPMRDNAGWWSWANYATLAGGLIRRLKPGGRMEWIINRGDQLPVAADPEKWAAIDRPGYTFSIDDNVMNFCRAAQ